MFSLLVACTKKQDVETFNPENTIRIEFDKQHSGFLDEIEDVNIIPLKFTDDFILSSFQIQLRINNDYMYFFDRNQKKMYVFDKNGDFKFLINKYGNGPEGYIQPSNFFISNNLDIYIFDKAQKKLLIFNKNGNYIKNLRIDCPASNVTYLNDSTFIAYAQTAAYFEKSKDGIKILDKSGKITNSFLHMPSWISNSAMSFATGSYFIYQNETPLLITPWNNRIYSIYADSVGCKYSLDFGKFNIPHSFFQENEDRMKDINTIQKMKDNGWVFFIDFLQESTSHVSFNLQKKSESYIALYSKKTRKNKLMSFSSMPTKWLGILNPFLCTYNDAFYTLVSVDRLELLLDDVDNNDARLAKIRNQFGKYKKEREGNLHSDDLVLLSFRFK